MWLFLENEASILAETAITCLVLFVFQLLMCRCGQVAVKLIPVYIFAAWHTVLVGIVMSLPSSVDLAGALIFVIYMARIIVESAFIGLAWLIYLFSRKRVKRGNGTAVK